MDGASKTEEDHMRLLTIFELATRSDSELTALFAKATRALHQASPESAERRNALASLENIQRVQAERRRGPRR